MNARVFALLIPGWPQGISEEQTRQDPGLADRLFRPVMAALEELAPGTAQLRPGLCVLRGRGVSRYYGGEAQAAAALLTCLHKLGHDDARVGVADSVFAAVQAARSPRHAPEVHVPGPGLRIVTPGCSAAFLSPLPIERAAETPLSDTLRGLGVRTLGQLAALPESAVRDRFGPAGITAHRRARAASPRSDDVAPQRPARDLSAELNFEPPLATAEQLAFACSTLAERFVTTLTDERLVCTELRIELTDDIGVRHERLWAHPGRFTAAEVVNRVRWQLDALPDLGRENTEDRGGAGIVKLQLTPTQTDRTAAHEPTLWSNGPNERVHHRFTQVQSRLGHSGIGTAQIGGGRLLIERQQLVPWGTRIRQRRPPDGPWPGALPGPPPSRVFPDPIPAELRDAAGEPIAIDGDELLTADPSKLRVGVGSPEVVVAWSLPWPLRELWWEGRPDRFRLQALCEEGSAWLLLHERGNWFAEGGYD